MGTNSRPATNYQIPVEIQSDNVSTAASLTKKIHKVRTGRKMRINQVTYTNPTGLAVDTSNFFVLELRNGSTSICSMTTHDTAIVADTPIDIPLNATDANAVLASGDILTFVLTKTGTQTLPIGLFIIHATLI
jgi:hypothetical protein